MTKYPALKLLLLSLFFFLTAISAGIGQTAGLILMGIALSFSLICLYFKKKEFSYLLNTAGIGLWLAIQVNSLYLDIPNKILPTFPAILEGEIVKIMNQDEKFCRCLVEGCLDTRELPKIYNTRVILTIFNKEKQVRQFNPGIDIATNVYCSVPQKSTLPTDFPEKQIAASLDAQWSATTNIEDVTYLGTEQNFYYYQELISNKIKNIIKELFPQSTSGIMIALITGDQTQIEDLTRQNFAYTGTVHVLSVSGLHIGVIAGIIYILLGFVYDRQLKFVIFVLLLASYIIITGFIPSALRAGCFVTAIMFVQTIQRRWNILNVLSFVTLAIILISPAMLLSLSFQMSLTAVFGIVILYRPIKEKLQFINKNNNTVVRYLLDSTALTISASLIVTPLCGLYFHIYSLISPLTNLIIVPLMSLAMIYGMLSLFFYPLGLGVAGSFVATAQFLVDASNYINSIAVEIPFAYIKSYNYGLLPFALSIAVILIIFSKGFKQTAFRLSVFILIIFFVTIIFHSQNLYEIYPRKNSVIVNFDVNDSTEFVLISDRKPHQQPFRDLGTEDFLLNKDKNLIIGINGNIGINTIDNLRKSNERKNEITIKIVEISLNLQNEIGKNLKIGEEIPQIVDVE